MIFKDEDKFIEVQAPDIKPFRVEVGTEPGKRYFIIHRPTLREYLLFESDYARLLATFMESFRGISFLSYQELADLTARDSFIKQFQSLSYSIQFIRFVKRMLKRYPRMFEAVGFRVGSFDKIATKTQVIYILVLIHLLVESEKKNEWEMLVEGGKAGLLGSLASSIFSKENSASAEPQYGNLM
jgi:hypothetical protein